MFKVQGLLIIALLYALPAFAGDHILLKAGQPFRIGVSKSHTGRVEQWNVNGERYIGQFRACKECPTLASFIVYTEEDKPGMLIMEVYAGQATALAGKKGQWSLLHFPEIGPEEVVAHGKMEVRP